MGIESLYCENCKKNYNVRKDDLELMKNHNKKFDGKKYLDGCFFKDLIKLKKAKSQLSN
ncbi:hypothetical protein [Halarcobacter sp.]|uniref:hypothetical protein n=1 Tax=Halarcobacter sp. TaxID=2321133 RepID=UPI0029F48D87|nr:hypothetical protein [Halarcobacter sp.]